MTFPREIRDQIYYELLGTTYVVHGQSAWKRCSETQTNIDRQKPEFAILRTSKAIKKEAEEVFHRCGIFVYAFGCSEDDTNGIKGLLQQQFQQAIDIFPGIRETACVTSASPLT